MQDRRLQDFLGRWQIRREIVHDDGTRGQFEGEAAWRAEGRDALYLETGRLSLGAQGAFQAERRYLWSSELTVFFEDGRLFHVVPPQGGDTAHWCPPDQYDGSYDFSHWPHWQVVWRVSGPRKSYVSTTRYSPLAGSTP